MIDTHALLSNVFVADFKFDSEIPGFDLYRVEGIPLSQDRFKLMGEAVGYLQRVEKRAFAQYMPTPNDNLIVGYLPKPPFNLRHQVAGLSIVYQGKATLPSSAAARRTITDLLNKTKFRELKSTLWSAGGHSFFPKEGELLNDSYPGSDLILFRGPFFRYNVLSDGRIVLSLDSTTHYIESIPFLETLKRNGVGWFSSELEEAKRREANQARAFAGLHFFYELYKTDVAIDGIDPRPISQITLSEAAIINGVECKTIAEYLRQTYRNHPGITKLDLTQPGLKGGSYTYAPQFLYRTVPLREVANEILVEESFLMDDAPRKYRDDQKPAVSRWQLIQNYFHQFNFQYAELGPRRLKMGEPLEFHGSNHFTKPRLLLAGSTQVYPDDVESALRNGFYREPRITKLFIYTATADDLSKEFYRRMVAFAAQNFGVSLPKEPMFLERDMVAMRNQLENSLKGTPQDETFCVGIIPKNSALHNELTNLWGELGVPSKCITVPVVEAVCMEGKASRLQYALASMLTRAGGIPWILYDRLHYDCYAAVDVGRSLAESWAMSIVYDKDGKFVVRQGKLIKGEDLDRQSLLKVVEEAHTYAPQSKSLIYLRDGDIFQSERQLFTDVVQSFSTYDNVAMISIKKNVPYRVFRKAEGKIGKPVSGDHFFLDGSTAVLCAAGIDEYTQGMPKPVVAEVIQVRGGVEPVKALEDLFRLAYLNWGSPGSSYSGPAPVRLAHLTASELSQGIRRFGSPF